MDNFERFMRDFLELSGIDLSQYKRPQMERRLTNLRDRRGFSDFQAYLDALASDATLRNELLDRMTINVSEFYRNPDRWEPLRPLLNDMKRRPIRAWSAACATGEEPYSLAMLLMDEDIESQRVLATDIDQRVLERARDGRYDRAQLRELDEEMLARYFLFDGHSHIVTKQLRNMVEFERHNLLSDPYPTDLDLIICRNVMIYFTETTKQNILRQFAAALRPGGLLFVGSTEQFIGLTLSNLEPVGAFLYRRTHD